jgi:indole-3-glycerol phosphate synthase
MLTEILESARERADVAARHAARFQAAAADAPAPIDFAEALAGDLLGVIAEVKRRSPSKGPLAPGLDPAPQVAEYARGGASAVSVLTEPHFFDGSLADLTAVRATVDLPVLRKDFLLHPAQVWEARAAGADAVLAIVAAVDDALLAELVATAEEAGIVALVEVHDEAELDRALAVDPRLVGVNNRNLKTFATDIGVALGMASRLTGSGIVAVAESGVSDRSTAAEIAGVGYDAILVGEALVTSTRPAELIGELRVPR